MNVAEKDPAVHNLLLDEHRRCLEVLEALQRKAEGFPKGALNVREKVVGGRRYRYHYLVYRDAGRVVNRHVPKAELPALKARLEERDKCKKEIATYRRRIRYLAKLLGLQAPRKARRGNPS